MLQENQNTKNREAVYAGRFYSATRDSLVNELNRLFGEAVSVNKSGGLRGLIAPHAGYMYSGKVAASAYSTISKEANYSDVFILATSHTERFKGAAVYTKGDYQTPLGIAPVNKQIAKELTESGNLFREYDKAHKSEHSVEVQIPFLQRVFGEKLRIIPIIIGTDNYKELVLLANALNKYFVSDRLFIVSSDFSHYPEHKNAAEIDATTANNYINYSAEEFYLWLMENNRIQNKNVLTRMCGWSSAVILKLLSENSDSLEYKLLTYSNSGDIMGGDINSVVGYYAISLSEKNKSAYSIKLEKSDRMELLDIAHKAIEARLYGKKAYTPDNSKVSDNLKRKAGVFVTLKSGKKLRGCIGSFNAENPLCKTVCDMAVSAAFSDYRFEPLSSVEYGKVSIEISVLTPMRKIDNYKEIVVGKHGVMIKFENRTATFLPQVATEQGWNREQLLSALSEKKAGLAKDRWKSAEIYIYEAIIIDESQV